MKLAVVGGGSTYTPELVDGFARLQSALPITELVLTDPAAGRLALVGGLAQRMFARAGHPGAVRYTGSLVDAVDGAEAALRKVREGGHALLVSDIAMPGEDGYSLIRKVRALEGTGRRLPAAAFTALMSLEDRARVLEAGFDIHLPKSIDTERLVIELAALASS